MLVDVILALALLTCISELLGAVGLFRLAPMTAGLFLVGSALWLAARRPPHESPPAVGTPRYGSASGELVASTGHPAKLFVSLGIASVVVADWASRTVGALHHGMTTPDTLWYHMPFAGRFVQDGSITSLHFVDFHSTIAFYPENGELFHALGLLFFANDILSPVLNMGWLALVFVASWCIGRPFGVGPVTLAAGAVLMATPGLVATQPGGAYTDVVGFALLAAAIGLLSNSGIPEERSNSVISARFPAICVAALAAGLALGTKFTFVAPVVALTAAVCALAPRGVRWRYGTIWSLLVMVTGSFWYVRNWVAIGNLIPIAIRVGPIRLPGPPGLSPNSSVASFLFNGNDWRRFFIPGLRQSLGPMWWAVIALMGAGLVLDVCMPRTRLHRMLALVGVSTGIAFIFTPQPLTVPVLYPNVPYNFVYNLRYSFVAVMIGLLVLPIVRVTTFRWVQWTLLGAFALTVLVTQLDSTIWPIPLFSEQFAPAVRGTDAALGAAAGLVTLVIGSIVLGWFRPRPPLSPRGVAALTAVAIILVGVGYGVQRLYLRDRYQNTEPLGPLYVWAQHVHNARMAITGEFSNDTYPLYGSDNSNYVQVLGQTGPNGAFSPIPNCRRFRQAVNTGRYREVVTVAAGDVSDLHAIGSRETQWMDQDPNAELIFRQTTHGYAFQKLVLSVFQIDGRLDGNSCPSAPGRAED